MCIKDRSRKSAYENHRMEKEISKRSPFFFQSYGKDRTEETTSEHLFYNENGDQIGAGDDMVWKLRDSLNSPKGGMEKVS